MQTSGRRVARHARPPVSTAPAQGRPEEGASRTGTKLKTRQGRQPSPAQASDDRAAVLETQRALPEVEGASPSPQVVSDSTEGPQLEHAGASAPTSESASARRAEQPPGAAERGGHLVEVT